jgi:hypothetical protein
MGTTRNLLIYDKFLVMILKNVINMHDLWWSQYFHHGSTSLDIMPIILWHFIRFITNRPIILWRSFKFVTDEKTLWFIMDDEPIVQSTWTHLLFLAYMAWIYHVGPTCQIGTEKKLFFGLPKYNIMSPWWPTCQIGVRLAHMLAQLGLNFFKLNSKCWKWESN